MDQKSVQNKTDNYFVPNAFVHTPHCPAVCESDADAQRLNLDVLQLSL